MAGYQQVALFFNRILQNKIPEDHGVGPKKISGCVSLASINLYHSPLQELGKGVVRTAAHRLVEDNSVHSCATPSLVNY